LERRVVPGCRYDLPVAAGADEQQVPAAEDGSLLWDLVEAPWAALGPGVNLARQALAARLPGARAEVSGLCSGISRESCSNPAGWPR